MWGEGWGHEFRRVAGSEELLRQCVSEGRKEGRRGLDGNFWRLGEGWRLREAHRLSVVIQSVLGFEGCC